MTSGRPGRAENGRRSEAQFREAREFVPQVVKRARKEAERQKRPGPGRRVFEPVEFGRVHEDDEELLVELVRRPGGRPMSGPVRSVGTRREGRPKGS